MIYYTMTAGGSRGTDVVAGDLEEALMKAEIMGYDVVDVTDYMGHICLVIAE